VGLVSLGASDHVEHDLFVVSHTPLQLAGVVLRDGCLVNEDILVIVVPCNEPIAVLHVEPLHLSSHLLRQDFFGCLVSSHILSSLRLGWCCCFVARCHVVRLMFAPALL